MAFGFGSTAAFADECSGRDHTGGTIAGVLIAFLNFSDRTVNTLAVWQYRTTPVAASGKKGMLYIGAAAAAG